MTGRSPARLLAPLALVTVVVALFLVVGGGSDSRQAPSTEVSRPSGSGQEASRTTTNRSRKRKQPKSYVVKSGDTPSAIAEKTGVSLQQIEELNPDLDPQSLSPGQRIKLRP